MVFLKGNLMTSFNRFLLTIALTMMWSPSFLFIKLAIQELPPLTVVTLRVSTAAFCFMLILLWLWRSLPSGPAFWGRMAVMSFFSSVAPFALFCYAEQTIESALAAILNGMTPIFTAILAQFFISSDRIGLQKCVGIILGTGGVLLLFAPKIIEGLNGTTMGMLAALAASFSYAISHIFGKKFTSGYKPFVAPAAQMITSALMLWPFVLVHDDFLNLPFPSFTAIGGVLGLGLLGTLCAFIIYYKLLEHSGPTAISMVACFFPVIGMCLGYLFFNETFTLWGLAGSGLIFLGMLLVNEVITFKTKEAVIDNAKV